MGTLADQGKAVVDILNYDLEYFINKFEAIPDEDWATGDYIDRSGRCCALGHCGVRGGFEQLPEPRALHKLTNSLIAHVNDGSDKDEGGNPLYGDTPKERVLNFLKELRDGKR